MATFISLKLIASTPDVYKRQVEKEWKKQPHVGEMPLDIVAQVIEHGDKAVAAIDKAAGSVSSNKDEFARLQNDMPVSYTHLVITEFMQI